MSAIDRAIRLAEGAELSKALSAALRLAIATNDEGLASWVRLELMGYFADNSAMSNAVMVPEYRSVAGQWIDDYNNVLLVTDPKLSFLNVLPLRQGVAELESITSASRPILIPDAGCANVIREELQVHVRYFRCTPYAVKQVVENIRANLLERLAEQRKRYGAPVDASSPPGPEILELKPGIYGISVNLKALWRRLNQGRQG